jgi:phosphonate degradation associated HDIG domain protein
LTLLNLIRSNRAGVVGAHVLMFTGFVLMALATLLLDGGVLSGIGWMILVGLGSYMAYVPHDSVLYDRIIASTRVPGTAVFAIYLADSIGYTGSIGLPLIKDQFFADVDRLTFFRVYTYIVSLGGIGILVASSVYFYRKHQLVPEAAMSNESPVDCLVRLFKEKGDAAYIGEPVSQTEHALQTAWAAERAGSPSSLIAAALLHDVGHLLHALPEDCAHAGKDDAHEILGARWLDQHFGPDIAEVVRLHVDAKRFLCATDPAYLGILSEASLRSLKLQGGPLTPEEVDRFRKNPHAEAALALRRFDELAKVPGLPTPDLEYFRRYLETASAARNP